MEDTHCVHTCTPTLPTHHTHTRLTLTVHTKTEHNTTSVDKLQKTQRGSTVHAQWQVD